MIEIPIQAVAKPRMTRSDRWKKRPVVQAYWKYKDKLVSYNITLPVPYKITFFLAMPESWSKKKRLDHDGKPHLQTPDKDNLEKGFLDAIFEDDKHIWSGWVEKRWSQEPKIRIEGL